MISPDARSSRLRLREFHNDDTESVARMHSDDRLRKLLLDDFPLNQRAVARAFIATMNDFYQQHPGLGIWHASTTGTAQARQAATQTPSTDFIGWFSLMPMPGRAHDIELGARLLPSAWGTGLSLAGAHLLLDHAFRLPARERVIATCHPDNRSAQVALAAMGFEATGQDNYAGQTASYFQIGLNRWHASRNVPVRTRLRQAIAAMRDQRTNQGRLDTTDECRHITALPASFSS